MSFSYVNNVFSELIKAYPEWNHLKNYLESDEGGLFRIVDHDETNHLVLIRYEKGVSKLDLPHSRWFRSVVWDTQNNVPISISPPKATHLEFPYNSLKDITDNGIVCEEFLDGFMINCFRIVNDEKLYISSRSKLNATGTFYSQKSFRTLFIEAYLGICDDSDINREERIQQNSEDIHLPDPSKEEYAVSYSFLVQHPEHRIVTNITKSRVFLIQKCTIHKNGDLLITDHIATFREGTNYVPIPLDFRSSRGSYAEIVRMQNEEAKHDTADSEVMQWLKMLFDHRSWEFQGVVFKDRSGNRWRFRSEKYMAVKALRGNSPTSLERFAHLYTQNLTHLYLEYYPKDSFQFTFNTVCLTNVIQLIYKFYIELNIKKSITLSDIDKMYHPHLYNLHGIFLSQLRPSGHKMSIAEIHKYFHKQPWQRIAFLIRKNQDSYFSNINNMMQTF
jgi:hypothetical protein